VPSIDVPVIGQTQIFLEIVQQIIARHDAAGEEVAGHPVGFVPDLEGVGESMVRENMHE